ncbi:MAG: flagellar protein FlgN [Planctomycetes bacterium]|nr:flagellar protein FlgN [Planctomycetota bacterium]
MPAVAKHRFQDLLHSRREHCRALLELSRHQRELIAADDYSRLLELLGRKQQVLALLTALDDGQREFADAWQHRRESIAGDERQACERLLAETDDLLRELVHEEHDSAELLSRRKAATAARLDELAAGARVHQGYRDDTASSLHRHLNLES